MNNVEIKFTGNYSDKLVFIDDKYHKLKKGKYGTLLVNYSTENSISHVKIVSYNEYSSKFWFIWQFIYFVFSIFGIFDWWKNKSEKLYILDAKLNLTENCKFQIKIKTAKANEPGAEIVSENQFEILTNIVKNQEQVKKRIKAFKIFKILFIIAVIIAVIVLIVF